MLALSALLFEWMRQCLVVEVGATRERPAALCDPCICHWECCQLERPPEAFLSGADLASSSYACRKLRTLHEGLGAQGVDAVQEKEHHEEHGLERALAEQIDGWISRGPSRHSRLGRSMRAVRPPHLFRPRRGYVDCSHWL